MSVPGIEAIEGLGGATGTAAAGFTPYVAPSVPSSAVTAGSGSAAVGGPDFGSLVADGIEKLDGVQRTADTLAVKAATGDLENLHDYTIAATQAQVTTQVTVAIRNKAVEAFTEIMRMQV